MRKREDGPLMRITVYSLHLGERNLGGCRLDEKEHRDEQNFQLRHCYKWKQNQQLIRSYKDAFSALQAGPINALP